jgi:hypothetical protein
VAQGEKLEEGGHGGLLRQAASRRSQRGSGGGVRHAAGLGRGSAGHRSGNRSPTTRERWARVV